MFFIPISYSLLMPSFQSAPLVDIRKCVDVLMGSAKNFKELWQFVKFLKNSVNASTFQRNCFLIVSQILVISLKYLAILVIFCTNLPIWQYCNHACFTAICGSIKFICSRFTHYLMSAPLYSYKLRTEENEEILHIAQLL